MDPGSFEAARIDHGDISLHDLLLGRMPAEVGAIPRAVALDVCRYLGQEPVVRLHYRGRANRTLRRLTADAPLRLVVDPANDDLDATFALREPSTLTDARAQGRLATWAERADGTTVVWAVLRRELPLGAELRLPDSTPYCASPTPLPTPTDPTFERPRGRPSTCVVDGIR